MSRRIRNAQLAIVPDTAADALVLMDSGSDDRSIDRYVWDDEAGHFAWAEVVATRSVEAWEPAVPTWRDFQNLKPWASAYPVPDEAGYELGAFLEVYTDGDHLGEGSPSYVVLWGPETSPIVTQMPHSASLPWRLAGIPFVDGYWWAFLHVPPDVTVSELEPEFPSLPANATVFQVVRYNPDFTVPTVVYQHYIVGARGWPVTYAWANQIAMLYRDDEANPFLSSTIPTHFLLIDLGLTGAAAIRTGPIDDPVELKDPLLAPSDPDAWQPGLNISGTQSLRRAQQFFTYGEFATAPMKIVEGFIRETGGDPELVQTIRYAPPTSGGWNAHDPPPLRHYSIPGEGGEDTLEGGSFTDGAGGEADAFAILAGTGELSRIEIQEMATDPGGPPESKRIRAAVNLAAGRQP